MLNNVSSPLETPKIYERVLEFISHIFSTSRLLLCGTNIVILFLQSTYRKQCVKRKGFQVEAYWYGLQIVCEDKSYVGTGHVFRIGLYMSSSHIIHTHIFTLKLLQTTSQRIMPEVLIWDHRY